MSCGFYDAHGKRRLYLCLDRRDNWRNKNGEYGRYLYRYGYGDKRLYGKYIAGSYRKYFTDFECANQYLRPWFYQL